MSKRRYIKSGAINTDTWKRSVDQKNYPTCAGRSIRPSQLRRAQAGRFVKASSDAYSTVLDDVKKDLDVWEATTAVTCAGRSVRRNKKRKILFCTLPYVQYFLLAKSIT